MNNFKEELGSCPKWFLTIVWQTLVWLSIIDFNIGIGTYMGFYEVYVTSVTTRFFVEGGGGIFYIPEQEKIVTRRDLTSSLYRKLRKPMDLELIKGSLPNT